MTEKYHTIHVERIEHSTFFVFGVSHQTVDMYNGDSVLYADVSLGIDVSSVTTLEPQDCNLTCNETDSGEVIVSKI